MFEESDSGFVTPPEGGVGNDVEVRAVMREEASGRWVGRAEEPQVLVSATTRERCLASLRRGIAAPAGPVAPTPRVTLVVEVVPRLAGVAEAAAVMGWDKRRVVTYIDRGHFPQPVQTLASGRVWVRSDVEDFAAEWRTKRSRRGGRRPEARTRQETSAS